MALTAYFCPESWNAVVDEVLVESLFKILDSGC